MAGLDDLPARDDNDRIAELSETQFRSAISRADLFIVQREDRRDFGTDIQIEALLEGSATNHRVHVQLKGTSKAANADGTVSLSVTRRNLNYLLTQPESLYVCYHLPTQRLLCRYAHDVFTKYGHGVPGWDDQESVTVRFAEEFDATGQLNLHSRVIATGRAARDSRLNWLVTPPKQIAQAVQDHVPSIDVPSDEHLALAILTKLYEAGQDNVISASFAKFEAALGENHGGIDLAYLAEINLAINGGSHDVARVKAALPRIDLAIAAKTATHSSLLYCRGNALLALGKLEDARDAYSSALLRSDPPLDNAVEAQCRKNLGTVLTELGLSEEGADEFERALRIDPGLAEAHLALAIHQHTKKQNPQLALQHLDRVTQRAGSSLRMAAVQGWRIEALFLLDRPQEAFREIRNLLANSGTEDWALHWCARQVALFGHQHYECAGSALRFWNDYLAAVPDDRLAQRERFFCASKVRFRGEDPEMEFDDFLQIGETLAKLGDPDTALIWDRIGHWAQDLNDWTSAERYFRLAYDLDAKSFGYCLGTSLNFLGRYEDALATLEPLIDSQPDDEMLWFQVAIAREHTRDASECALAYCRAIELDPDYAKAWFNLGGIYFNNGLLADALAVWNKALSKFPDDEMASQVREVLKGNSIDPDQAD